MSTPVRIAVPSKGRLRDDVVEVLGQSGYSLSGLRGRGSIVQLPGLDVIEMRPHDAAAALGAGTIDGAFIATDIAMEAELADVVSLPLGFSRSQLIVAVRDDAGIETLDDLAGGVVATHMPNLTARFLADHGVDPRVLPMGGSLEGLVAAGLADAIVDNTETGTSLRQNHLSVVATIADCEAEFVHRPGLPLLADLETRLQASLRARQHRYVMLHIAADQVDALAHVFPGLAAPTVLPLAGRDDLVAAHFVVRAADFWDQLSTLSEMGATGIVALQPDTLAP